jgi:hypothetical protein
MIPERFRRDYDGEFVVLHTRISGGIKEQRREWIPNPIENFHISGRAVVIGSRSQQDQFQHQRLQRHRGGLLGKKKVQTYSCDDIWTDMFVDFYVSNNSEYITQILEQNYDTKSTVYTRPKLILEHPGRLYPVPYGPLLSDPALAVYLAAFDQHQEVFLLGMTNDTKYKDRNTVDEIRRVIESYRGTKFYGVGESPAFENSWRNLPNFETMSIRKFVSYCDI